MKVVVTPVRHRLRRPLVTSHGALEVREGVQVTVVDGAVTGRGEAFPWESFGTEPLDATIEALRAVRPAPFDAVEALAAMLEPLASAPAARFAMEGALLEWLARRKGLPVAELLGTPRPVVPVNALIEGTDAQTLAASAHRAVEAGFKTVKVKVGGRPTAVDAQRLWAVRQAVGPAVAIRIDANGGWSEGLARSTLRGLESLKLELCEQPVAPHDVEALRRVSVQVPMPVAADEVLADRGRWHRVLAPDPRPAAPVLVLKPAVLGGLTVALDLARRASAHGVTSYVTTLMDGPIARAAATHLAAVLPPGPFAHGLSTVELFADVSPDAYTPRSGAIELPSSPGWGL